MLRSPPRRIAALRLALRVHEVQTMPTQSSRMSPVKRPAGREPEQPERHEDGAGRRRYPRTDADQLGVLETPVYPDELISFPIRVS